MMAYNHLDVQLRVLLPKTPSPASTIGDLLQQIMLVKPNWFDLYKPLSQSNRYNQNNFGKNNRGRPYSSFSYGTPSSRAEDSAAKKDIP